MHSLKLFKDPRHFQILFQASFLFYGISFLHWNSPLWLYVAYVGTGFLMHCICEMYFTTKEIPTWSAAWWQKWRMGFLSALISSFGLCLFLKTNHLAVAMGASALAIVSKYTLRVNGKHLFNPSALGIVIAVMFTGKAWVNPGQWGSGVFLFAGMLTLGTIVVTRVQKLDISLAFLSTFALLHYIRQIMYLQWPFDFFAQTISTGTVLVFSFFMISDPKTTPNHPVARILWAMGVAILAFYLSSFKYLIGAPVFALVFFQPLVPLFDKIFKAGKFQWPGYPTPQQAKPRKDFSTLLQ